MRVLNQTKDDVIFLHRIMTDTKDLFFFMIDLTQLCRNCHTLISPYTVGLQKTIPKSEKKNICVNA